MSVVQMLYDVRAITVCADFYRQHTVCADFYCLCQLLLSVLTFVWNAHLYAMPVISFL